MDIKELNYPVDVGVSKIIKEKGLKQCAVAEKAGYSSQELNAMLNGRRLIKVCDVPKLAEVLGVKSDEIYAVGKKVGK